MAELRCRDISWGRPRRSEEIEEWEAICIRAIFVHTNQKLNFCTKIKYLYFAIIDEIFYGLFLFGLLPQVSLLSVLFSAYSFSIPTPAIGYHLEQCFCNFYCSFSHFSVIGLPHFPDLFLITSYSWSLVHSLVKWSANIILLLTNLISISWWIIWSRLITRSFLCPCSCVGLPDCTFTGENYLQTTVLCRERIWVYSDGISLWLLLIELTLLFSRTFCSSSWPFSPSLYWLLSSWWKQLVDCLHLAKCPHKLRYWLAFPALQRLSGFRRLIVNHFKYDNLHLFADKW